MRKEIKASAGLIAAGAVVAGSVIGASVWIAALAAGDLRECAYPDNGSCIVDHNGEGPAKDSAPLDARMPAVTVTSPPVVTALPVVSLASADSLPPCPTEDSEGCYWDASEQGNGDGADVVTPVPETAPEVPAPVTEWAPRPADTERATGPVQEYDEGVLFCGVGAKPALDVDPFGNWWAYCEPALID
ncbi:hypothetical protein SEA_RUBYRALPH_101 [Microbacterium phage RubyRalph]|nr:hypothetical protein SEA_RUBYRALPH_101 [Microbacterium phage RubyRalph]